MLELTFGEQVKIVLSRKGMTIKQLAEMIEERTGKKMSRQNLTQRLSRDNFQEQDMRLIASILDCPFHLSILEESSDSEHVVPEKKRREVPTEIMDAEPEQLTLNLEFDTEEPEESEEVVEPEEAEYAEEPAEEVAAQKPGNERDITIGELVDIQEESTADTEESEKRLEYGSGYVEEPMYGEEEYAEEPTYEEEEYAEEPAYDEAEYVEEPMYGEEEYAEEPEYVEEPAYEEAEYVDESSYEEQPQENNVSEILEEVAAIEAEEKKAREEKEKEKEQEKPRGWRAYLSRRKKKQAEEVTEKPSEEKHYQEDRQVQEEEHFQDQNQYQTQDTEENQEYEEYVQESEQEMEEEFTDTAGDWEVPEEENVGEINPYTGMEYESNSVRVHPKRIGYVQVYDRSDHQWTDMTEWAFLGYQERKKALLGKDYEPPIYLD